ncbi:rod shape-determining protein MreD [Aurantiacibacter atlanticus]|uniref:Rod shape-determining protein MreD n=1 Tax=Aurantiacibacter atlanticus TaxID=1648404 RepID=A0A0H4VCD1_9SPHN|nr:rod shape-determining protein MreD [Aurantiacibacter atlanticus]AKQ42322.1 rod shape-determining protein MreD [Aurantiacibacter atlanticus]MDF1834805.1 rod shape-determining protein MreD [Alteraurantiacibacter sp. bin_em_oilr2.035]
MEQLNPSARRDQFGSKINRDHSPVLSHGVPWAIILLACMSPLLPIIASAPLVPPLGYMFLLGWRVLRPGILPLWAGLPIGLFDDMFSGQPLGSGALLFSLTMIAIDLIEMRFPWRGFWQDWGVASIFLALYLALAAIFSGASLSLVQFTLILPQLALSILIFPLVAQLVSLLDRFRLKRVRRFG